MTSRLEAAAQALGAAVGEDDAAALLEAVVARIVSRRHAQKFQVEIHTNGGRIREASIHPPEPILSKGA